MTDFKDAAIRVLSDAGKPLRVAEIAKRAIAGGYVKTKAKDPRGIMWNAINNDIKKFAEESEFVKAGNSTYRLRSPLSKSAYKDNQSPDQEKTKITARGGLPRNTKKDEMSKLRLAAASEYRVISELLLREYDANKSTIDDGVDVWATKDGRQFQIQVKAATRRNNTYTSSIKKKSFSKKHNPDMHYVFVLKDVDNRLNFVIFSSEKLSKMISTKKEHTASYTVHLSKKGDKVFLSNHDVTKYINVWDF